MQDFSGKTAVVTGAASGIGRAMAEKFLGLGMNVVLSDIEEKTLQATVAELSNAHSGEGSCVGVSADVSQQEQVDALAKAAQQHYGSINIACNNAGVFAGGLLWENSLADYRWQMGVNLWGIIHGIRTFVPIMQQQGDECHIVNTASMAAVTSMPYSGIYNMTKHSALALSEALYHELAFHVPNVKVSVLCPEAINTGISRSERNRPAEYSSGDDIVSSDESAMVLQALVDSTAGGISPAVMADRVHQAIIDEQFYILSNEAWREAANTRLDDIREGRNPTFAPPVAQ